MSDFCPTATIDTGGLKASGNISYKADLTYSGTLTFSGSMAMVLPSSCLTVQGIKLTCGQVDQAVKQAMAEDPEPSIQSVSCAGSGTCRCTFVMTPQTETGSGTYTTSGHTLTEEDGSTSDYCVQGSKLYVSEMSMDGDLAVSGSIVLTK